MKTGCVVWFNDHSRPFLIRESFCTSLECTCQVATLTFEEILEPGQELADRQTLEFCVDLETWLECEPVERSAQATRRIQHFLRNYPDELRSELRRRMAESRSRATRIASYVIDLELVTQGTLVPFSDLVADPARPANHEPDFDYSYFRGENEFLIQDYYCPNPACDCQGASFCFYVATLETRTNSQTKVFKPLFLGKAPFDVEQDVSIESTVPSPVVAMEDLKSLFKTWLSLHVEDVPIWKDRYRQVKEAGKRSLARASRKVSPPPSAPQTPSETWRKSSTWGAIPAMPPPDPARVGRNAPCPCGSGIKYKRCCGRPE